MIQKWAPRVSPLDISTEDLDRCHDLLGRTSWSNITGNRIFITGGTGFVGKWFLATLLDANDALGLGCHITVLSRDPSAFLSAWPGMANRVEWITGDVRDMKHVTECFDVIVHAATDVIAQTSPEDVFATCLDGTRQVLTLAHHCGASRVLLVSSGAVYGPLPEGMTHVPETYLGGPDPLESGSAYGEGKRASEWLAAQAARRGVAVKIARIFAVVGPHLPLDKHFAIGNFLRSAMDGIDIIVQGDGSPHRSYLYGADMAAWLWAVLLRGGVGRAYNVGSEESVSILNLARRVSTLIDSGVLVRTLQNPSPNQTVQHYVPDTHRARSELCLDAPLPLDQALLRTARWYRTRNV